MEADDPEIRTKERCPEKGRKAERSGGKGWEDSGGGQAGHRLQARMLTEEHPQYASLKVHLQTQMFSLIPVVS